MAHEGRPNEFADYSSRENRNRLLSWSIFRHPPEPIAHFSVMERAMASSSAKTAGLVSTTLPLGSVKTALL